MENEYKLQKGDELFIHFKDEYTDKTGTEAYALCEYVGRDKKRNYLFDSVTYGWRYVVNKEKTKVTHFDNEVYFVGEKVHLRLKKEGKEYDISDMTGWLKYLP